jgi:hypothetical protein
MDKYRPYLDELRKLLQMDQDYPEVMNYFMDHFGNNPEFVPLSKKTTFPLLADLMRIAAKRNFKCHVNRRRCVIFTYANDGNFFHGKCNADVSGLIVVFFFKDIDMGMMVYVDPARPSGLSSYAHFSLYAGKDIDARLAGKTLIPSDQSSVH